MQFCCSIADAFVPFLARVVGAGPRHAWEILVAPWRGLAARLAGNSEVILGTVVGLDAVRRVVVPAVVAFDRYAVFMRLRHAAGALNAVCGDHVVVVAGAHLAAGLFERLTIWV